MALFSVNSWYLPGDGGINLPGIFHMADGTNSIAFAPTFDDIKAHAATFTTRARRCPFALRRYISEYRSPPGQRRPLSPSVARQRMLAKLLEFDERFYSAQTYDDYCEPVSHLTAPYDCAEVLSIVAPWMYTHHEDEELPGMRARVRV